MNAPRPIVPVGVTAWTATCAAGHGLEAIAAAVARGASALRPNDWGSPAVPGWIGRVDAIDAVALPAALAAWDGRATRLAWLGLLGDGFADAVAAACARHGAGRVGLALGTSASTIGVSEQACRELGPDGGFAPRYANPRLNTPHALAAFVQEALALAGPALTVSTACSSSAKAVAVGERWLRLGLVDAVVVGGVDALCGSLLYGFAALGLVAPAPCRPFDARRCGISVGEAAAFALLERAPAPLALLGYGESNDGHHMSSPHPHGVGAERALDAALARSGLDAGAIDLVSLHGTATPANDAVEAALVARRYAPTVHAAATKGLAGHAMGAAGLLEAAIALLALAGRGRAGSVPTAAPDPALGPVFARQFALAPAAAPARHAAVHSFGFGGNNCVLVFGRAD